MNQRTTYHYALEPSLIAAWPTDGRSESRLLHVQRKMLADRVFSELPTLLNENDLLVVNDARVAPVRLSATRETGGRVEVFIVGTSAEGVWDDAGSTVHALLNSNRRIREGETLSLTSHEESTYTVRLDERLEGGVARMTLSQNSPALDQLLDALGAMPLPPYIVQQRNKRDADNSVQADDRERYQTVYAEVPGAVAAPTAGLHFDEATLQALSDKGIPRASVTLLVGIGTFRPVKAERLDEHEMHTERYRVPTATRQAIEETRSRGGRVVAVGTTVVRALEAWAADNEAPHSADDAFRETDIFIRPGFRFRVVDRLVTNFHLPESTLLTLVCAFAGYKRTMSAYEHAVRERYRFYSYGDAMLLERDDTATITETP